MAKTKASIVVEATKKKQVLVVIMQCYQLKL